MNRYANVQLHITHHAHEQYCERVESINEDVLRDECLRQLKEADYGHNKEWFIHLAGVWWVFDLKDDQMTFITCYGRTTMNIPKAVKWERIKKDRIDLKNTV